MVQYAETVSTEEEILQFEVCEDPNCTRCVLIKEILALKYPGDVLVVQR